MREEMKAGINLGSSQGYPSRDARTSLEEIKQDASASDERFQALSGELMGNAIKLRGLLEIDIEAYKQIIIRADRMIMKLDEQREALDSMINLQQSSIDTYHRTSIDPGQDPESAVPATLSQLQQPVTAGSQIGGAKRVFRADEEKLNMALRGADAQIDSAN